MEKIIKSAKDYLKAGQVEQVSENFWEVGEKHTVKLIKSPGRNVYSCSCPNATRFCNSGVTCAHIIAVLLFEAQDYKAKALIRENLEYFENCKKSNMTPELDVMICLLHDLRRFIW